MERKMKNKTILHTLALVPMVLGLLVLLVAPVFAHSEDVQLKLRLEKLTKELEQKRQQLHIPGMAIAIVKDNKVILAKGFGLSDLENNTPVTPETLFAIGSSSKAFTSTIDAMMVDEGKLNWDNPITDYLPFYQFKMKNKKDQITLRDMLSHRSGFSRNDILWVNGKVSRNDILHDATHAEAFSDFRKKFNYNNVMYLAAGVAAAKQQHQNWDDLLEQRLLKPLEMNHTTTRLKQIKDSPKLSMGYMWLEEEKKYKHLPMRNLANIAPAGAINSNVMDMTHWLKFQLNGGVYKNKRLVSEKSLMQTRTSQIKIANKIDYGMGWFIRQWQGQKVVEHGGNIDGFGAQVAFLPESKLGFVLLTNVTATPLQQESMHIVWDNILGEIKQPVKNNVKENADKYQPYIGEYIANFGPFKEAIFTFKVNNGKGSVDVPGQTLYELKDADSKGNWQFALTDTISVSFDRNKQGKISAMRLHQNGFDFELPRKGISIEAEISADKLQKFLGSYTSKLFKADLGVKIQNHRLAIDVPGQMVFELSLPDEKGLRHFRIKDSMSIKFETNDSHQIIALNVYKAGKKIDSAKKIQLQKIEKLPTLAEIDQLRKAQQQKKQFLNSGGLLIKGHVSMLQAGITGGLVIKTQGFEHYQLGIDMGKYGSIVTTVNKKAATTDESFSPLKGLHGKYFKQAQRSHPFAYLDFNDFYDDITIIGTGKVAGKKVYELNLKSNDLPTVTLFIDSKTGDILKMKTRMLIQGLGTSMPVTTTFDDYRDIEGLRIPFVTTVRNQGNGNMVFKYDVIKNHQNFDKETFKLKEVPQI